MSCIICALFNLLYYSLRTFTLSYHTMNKSKESASIVLKHYGDFLRNQQQELFVLNHSENWEETKLLRPILGIRTCNESVTIAELNVSDNTVITKILNCFASLCLEISILKEEAFKRHFNFLAIYEEYNKANINLQIDSIYLLSAFIARCNETLCNIINQVFALYSHDYIQLDETHLHLIVSHIGELFSIIVLTEKLMSNITLPTKWKKFSDDYKSYRDSLESFDFNKEMYDAVDGAIDGITSRVMNDDIVQTCLHNLLSVNKNLKDKKLSFLKSEFSNYLKNAIATLDKIVEEKIDMDHMFKCIKINSLFVLIAHVFGVCDKKILKSLINLNIKAHSIPIIGTAVWFPDQFLQCHLPSSCSSYLNRLLLLNKYRHDYLNAKKASLHNDLKTLQDFSSAWILEVDTIFSSKISGLNAADMNKNSKLLLEGLEFISSVNYTILTVISLHFSLSIPLPKSFLMLLIDTVDVLKALKEAVTRNYYKVVNFINMIIQHLVFQATTLIIDAKKKLMINKNYATKNLDELTCLVIAKKSLEGPPTTKRLMVANIALSFIPKTKYMEDSYSKLGTILDKINIFTNFITSVDKFCNCHWMLWHKSVITVYFKQNFGILLNPLKLKSFLSGIEDCVLYLRSTDKMFKSDNATLFLKHCSDLFENEVLKNLSQQVETDLRLHIHSHLQLDVVNPFTFDMDKKILLAINNFKIEYLYMLVKPYVENYLSTTYYNLTTVVISDWKTYAEMREMAKFKFDLITVEDHLPTQTLEQRLDVLEIMRNIHIFVSKYQYNLNNQIFIEKNSSKNVKSINIKYISNSIRTHGTGIMNTTVNYTYQFLKKKFYIFSQFMFDEHIKSMLSKDVRHLKDIASQDGYVYPYEHAEKFNKDIKNLGLNNEGQSYLDLFRELITQIGNSMGYVRMIRSGGRHCCSEATAFLPYTDQVESFEQLARHCSSDTNLIESVKNLDECIENLFNKFLHGTEYFKLLVEVFSQTFTSQGNEHLKNFFLIIPPLTLNFIEHMIVSKDKISKRNSVGATFTDDGFSMGVAYILKLLDQDSKFESLLWFDSVWEHIMDESKSIDIQKTKGSVQLQQALALSERKVRILKEEFELLYYSLTSARIFFR